MGQDVSQDCWRAIALPLKCAISLRSAYVKGISDSTPIELPTG